VLLEAVEAVVILVTTETVAVALEEFFFKRKIFQTEVTRLLSALVVLAVILALFLQMEATPLLLEKLLQHLEAVTEVMVVTVLAKPLQAEVLVVAVLVRMEQLLAHLELQVKVLLAATVQRQLIPTQQEAGAEAQAQLEEVQPQTMPLAVMVAQEQALIQHGHLQHLQEFLAFMLVAVVALPLELII
jgi:hypothetical protein